jgi:hypothetical protein
LEFFADSRNEKAPSQMPGGRANEVASLARHAATLAFVRIDRNQKSISVGVGEFVSLYIGAVIEGTVHFEAVIVLCPKIFFAGGWGAWAGRRR